MMLTKFAVTAVLLVSTVLVAAEAPMKLRIRMKGVKRDASHIANYYLPAHQYSHHGGGGGGGGFGAGGYSAGGLQGAQHLNVLDVKLPQSGGHYIPHYAIPAKSYESNAHHFPSHMPQFSHSGAQYVVSGGHGAGFDELSKVLGGQAQSSGGHISFGGASSAGHGYAAASSGAGGAQAAPAYGYNFALGGAGHQSAGFGAGHQGAGAGAAQGGYSFVSNEAAKTGPLSFGDASQSAGAGQQHQQQPTTSSLGGHQFGFVAGGHEQAAPQITYIPQAQALTSSASHGQTQTTPVYAVGMKGLGHYATGGSSFGHGLSLGSGSNGIGGYKSFNLGQSLGGLSFGGHGGNSYGAGGSYGGQHGGFILDTSALQGLNLGGKLVVMSKPTALTYSGQSYAHHAPKYQFPSSSSYSSLSSSGGGGYKSAAPFKPSVFLGATQENVSEYQHGGGYGQEAVSYSSSSTGGGAADYSSGAGQEYKYLPPTVASYGTSSSGGH